VAQGLARSLGHGAGAMFAIILLNASIIGAAAVTLSTSYAFGDVFGVQHPARRVSEAKFFYASYTAMVVVAAGIVLIPRAPLGVITTSVQALAGSFCRAHRLSHPFVQRRSRARSWVKTDRG